MGRELADADAAVVAAVRDVTLALIVLDLVGIDDSAKKANAVSMSAAQRSAGGFQCAIERCEFDTAEEDLSAFGLDLDFSLRGIDTVALIHDDTIH
jgi:hypothetical protein